MARGTPMNQIVKMLKAEIGDFSGTNTTRDLELKQLICTKQIYLAGEHWWPFLECPWEVGVAPGTRYVDYPTTTDDNNTECVAVNLDWPVTVETFFNQVYLRVDYGIGSLEYNTLNPDLGQFSDPIQRWRMASNPEDPNPNQFEVWPVPGTQQNIRFTGQRALLPFLGDADRADIDDTLLVLLVAAEILMRKKSADADIKLRLANNRMKRLRQGLPTREKRRFMDGCANEGEKRRLVGAMMNPIAVH